MAVFFSECAQEHRRKFTQSKDVVHINIGFRATYGLPVLERRAQGPPVLASKRARKLLADFSLS